MAEVLVEFDTPLRDGRTVYRARAVGRRADDGMWEGWMEFIPGAEGAPVIGSVESRQPERSHLVYWATGLSPVFLEGALDRALRPTAVRVRDVAPPLSQEPAARPATAAVPTSKPDAVLDPFHIGRRNLDVLRQELTALNRPRLLNIIAAFDLNPVGKDLSWMSDAQLGAFIVAATEAQLLRGARP